MKWLPFHLKKKERETHREENTIIVSTKALHARNWLVLHHFTWHLACIIIYGLFSSGFYMYWCFPYRIAQIKRITSLKPHVKNFEFWYIQTVSNVWNVYGFEWFSDLIATSYCSRGRTLGRNHHAHDFDRLLPFLDKQKITIFYNFSPFLDHFRPLWTDTLSKKMGDLQNPS